MATDQPISAEEKLRLKREKKARYMREYMKKHPLSPEKAEAKRARSRRNAKADREKRREFLLERTRKWKREHRESLNAGRRAKYTKEEYLAWRAQKVAEDPEYFKRQYQRAAESGYAAQNLRKFHLKYKYGLTIAQYDAMVESQNGACAICCKPETATHKKSGKTIALAVDHDHRTGRLRKLLCRRCNQMIGLIEESLELLRKAVSYLEQYQDE